LLTAAETPVMSYKEDNPAYSPPPSYEAVTKFNLDLFPTFKMI